MKVKRVEHVAIAVKNIREAMRIFQEKLGLALKYEEDFPQYQTKIAMYPVGETYLELLEATGQEFAPRADLQGGRPDLHLSRLRSGHGA